MDSDSASDRIPCAPGTQPVARVRLFSLFVRIHTARGW